MSNQIKTLDDVISIVGHGLWNVPFFVISSLNYGMNAVYLVEMEFLAPSQLPNSTERVNKSSEHGVTFTEEFDLTLSREYLRSIHQMMYSIGAFLGCVIAATASNRYGHQRSVCLSSLFLAILTIFSVSLPWLYALMAIRFLTGVCLTVSLVTSLSIGMECSTISNRPIFGILCGLPYPLMLIVVPGIAYFTRDWRTIHGCASIPIFVNFFFANPLVLKESPRWLLEKGRVEEAASVIRRGARFNKTSYNLPENLEQILKDIQNIETLELPDFEKNAVTLKKERIKSENRGSYLKSRSMQVLFLITIINGILIGILYLAIPLRTKISSSPIIFMAVLGILEVPSCTFFIPFVQKFGRKKVYFFCSQLMAAILLMLMIMTILDCAMSWVDTALSGTAYTCVGCLIMLFQLYVSELYPTSIRLLGSGLAYAMVCVGYNIPPLLEIILPREYFNWLSLLVYVASAFLGGILVLLLPETNRKPLLQSVQEYVRFVEENK